MRKHLEPTWVILCATVCLLLTARLAAAGDAPAPPLRPVVQLEETVYSYEPADNGAGPMWCSGSTCLVRTGEDLFASGLETIAGCPPLNNCRWTLFHRDASGWQKRQTDETDRTREPSPIVAFPDGTLFLSSNPTLRTNREAGGGPAQPQLLQFPASNRTGKFNRVLPAWEGEPKFTEHSYRSFAADAPNRELILFQNIGYTHAEWTLRDRTGAWARQGKLTWPWGAEYDRPEPIRVCYPTVALKNRAVYFCGVSDVIEPYQKWREFKKELTGREWDYDFRRLFYTWTEDITTGQFHPWIEIASRDKTCGWIFPGDLWVAPDGAVHILWSERVLDERLRPKFFPEAKQAQSLNYAVVRNGVVSSRQTLFESREGEGQEVPSGGRFQVTPDNRLIVFFYVQGRNQAGQAISENRVLEIRGDGQASVPVKVPLRRPFSSAFTATIRAGSPPSSTLELLGDQVGERNKIGYARIKLW